MRGWRALGLFWCAVLGLTGASAGILQYLGPPAHVTTERAGHPPEATARAEPQKATAHAEPRTTAAHADQHGEPPKDTHPDTHADPHSGATANPDQHPGAAPDPEPRPAAAPGVDPHAPAQTASSPPAPPNGAAVLAAVASSRRYGGPIAGPDPALLQPAPDFPGAKLPVANGGRTPSKVYARRIDPLDSRPKLGLLFVGVGLSDAESRAAIEMLPGGVTLGFSPYTQTIQPLLEAARARGHELFVTLPMESQGYPLNDSGPHALLTSADPIDNARNLEWVLSRIAGAVGVTGASDGLRGERFANSPGSFSQVMGELETRGLLYVDPRPKAAVTGAAIAVTTIVDEPPLRASIETRLADLEQRARDGKPALGLAGPLRPATVEQIANWARGLDGRGVNLVPVSALLTRSHTQ